jgi:hypothetical protein
MELPNLPLLDGPAMSTWVAAWEGVLSRRRVAKVAR